MILGLFPMAAFAEETTKPVVHLTADKTSVLAGQEVTLTLALDGDISGKVAGWEWDMIYDSKYFEITGSQVGTAAQPVIADDPDFAVTPIVNHSPKTKDVTGTYVYASVTSGNSIVAHYLKKGTIATLTLKAKEDIEDDISSKFYFVPIIVMNSSGTALDVVDADPATNWGKADFLAGKMPADTVGLSVDVKKALEPIDITVYYSDNGTIVTGKDGTLLNYAPVTVTDVNGDGKFTMYDGFACFHDKYHVNGAAGYEDNNWVTKFWSVNTAMVSYGHNNGWVYSTAEEIADGDSLCLFTYQDQTSWSDLFTYFDSLTATATANEETTFHVNGYSFFGSGKIGGELVHATAAPVGATVTATCGDKTLTTTTDANGDFKLTFPAAGEWTVVVSGTCSYTCAVGYYAGQTYTNAPVAPAQMTVTVEAGEEPDPQPPVTVTGYTVTMGEDKAAIVGETVQIAPVIGYTTEDVDTYNAFDMTFTYDPAVLKLTSTQIEGVTITDKEGTVNVRGYGADRTVGTAPFTLTFETLTTGDTNVKLTSAKVDISGNAIDKNAPEAAIPDDTTIVSVGGYPVTLPENFTGNATAQPGQDYTFSEPEDYYDYTVTVTVGDQTVEPTDNGDGSYTIPGDKVTGAITVTASKTGKKFNVTLGKDMTGEPTAQYMADYTAKLEKKNGYSYDVSVTIGGKAYTGYTVSQGSYSIPGSDITGDIVFTVTRTAIEGTVFSVTFEGSGAADATGSKTVSPDADYTFTVAKTPGYDYTVTAKMGGQDVSFTEAENKYTIENVSGDLVIHIEKVAQRTVEVSQYVELNGKTIFLVTAIGTLETGKSFAYDGTAMVYSEAYNAWCYLVIVEKGTSFDATIAGEKITATATSFETIDATLDVNASGLVDINDAQLVYDIYNGKYENFDTVTMKKFLYADTNSDRTVNVTDAAAVVAAIQ